ncbi:hypothetical protein HanIR_Chr08g0347481 [Helianthus annuus]|nr:hypothetical protein HanIR_Chr08g0347481 [Helianthus annuus]
MESLGVDQGDDNNVMWKTENGWLLDHSIIVKALVFFMQRFCLLSSTYTHSSY